MVAYHVCTAELQPSRVVDVTQLVLSGTQERLPSLHPIDPSAVAASVITVNAAGETLWFCGYITLENPLSGSKTLSAAGGGKIVWYASTVTFANGSSTFKVGIQDLLFGSGSVAQGDGTFDVEASFTGGGGGITNNATNESAMTSGTKTIAQGDLVAITFTMTARSGADTVSVLAQSPGVYTANMNYPVSSNNTVGATAATAIRPNAYIVFDDGTVGWIYGTAYISGAMASITYNSGTATADEYGNLIIPKDIFHAAGIGGLIANTTAGANFEAILYSDPLGTPVAERTTTVTQATTAAQTGGIILFSSPFRMKAGTPYAIAIRPTTTTSIVQYYHDGHTTAAAAKVGPPNANCYAVRRLDNSGAFSDYNGGTAKTRLMILSAIGMHIPQNRNQAGYQLRL